MARPRLLIVDDDRDMAGVVAKPVGAAELRAMLEQLRLEIALPE